MTREEISKELAKKLDPSHVKPPAPGKYGEYLEAWHVINEANRIFGFLGWSYALDTVTLTNATKDADQKHHVGYMAMVTVTAEGVSRGDVGHGQGHGKSEGDAHDSAVKEAVTDALKRALRTFGSPFGLALYDKSKAQVGISATAVEVDAAIQQIGGLADMDALKTWWSALVKNARHVAEDADVIAAKDARKDALSQKEAA